MSRLLFEIGTEAIPAEYLPPALRQIEERAARGLAELRLGGEGVTVRGTPHRLVLEIDGLALRQEDMERVVQGPKVEVAFKDGVATRAAEGFARKNGVSVEQLERVDTDRGTLVVARALDEGRAAAEVLPVFLQELTAGISWPKTMRWNAEGYLFPRPVRWVVAMLDGEVLPFTLAGLDTGRCTRGHRFLGAGEHELADASSLEDVLRDHGVILDPAERKRTILAGLAAEAERLGGRVLADPGLVEEVVHLAEHPTVYSGSFDTGFLDIPREVVVIAMRSHQRYFAVEDTQGKLLPHFLVVCEGRWDDPTQVITGNERVLRARLADARFYWDVDLKTGMDALARSLDKVVWLESLGTLFDKTERVAGLVASLGTMLFPAEWPAMSEAVLRGARLAKADLASEMIKDGKEFTGLQGIMGSRYAEALGESPDVVRTIAEQYLPRGAADDLPGSPGGLLLGLADRADTLAGCWAAGFVPSGSQDPYALRRAGNGIVRLALEKNLNLDLGDLVRLAVNGLPAGVAGEGLVGELEGFLRERIAYFLKEAGTTYDVVDAVLATGAADAVDARARSAALEAVRGEPDLEKLVIGFKRAANIVKDVDTGALPDPASVDWSAAEPPERALHEAARSAAQTIAAARDAGDNPAMLRSLLGLREPIDAFFDGVMVMAEDPAEKARRLALLNEVKGLFDGLADLSRIVIQGD